MLEDGSLEIKSTENNMEVNAIGFWHSSKYHFVCVQQKKETLLGVEPLKCERRIRFWGELYL